MEDYNKESKYLRAKERVDRLKKFYTNLASYIVVISVLALINYLTNGWRYMWFLWAAFGWGIGILFHAIGTFDLNPFFGRSWEERKIKEFMREDDEIKRWE
ncbi:2TM domain-containing protein [Muriicola jejuensis]|uniref:Histidine kinase n=1 Tax=Muriicola jejuensis TaxID=504488 RepID=A0A6P0UII7_9FLAO|nr:2TM domain-containing protein [Muriicola jejuensis]NER10923.1 histidine kinase [Muriicola jejuensis]SMP15550.1 2TM domain-containing protein [Muriicola jejuensis]